MYAFSVGFMSTAMFIRMYALLTLMTLLCTYVHLNILKHDFKFNKKLLTALFFAVLGGYYTQYYFVLYAIGIAVVMVVLMILKQRWKSLFAYIFTLCGAAVTGIGIWPFSIKHVFGGYRGQASLNVLQTGNFYWYKSEYMLNHIVDNTFGGIIWLPIILAVFCIGISTILRKNAFPFAKTAVLVVPITFYTLIVGQISPFLTDRYVMCTYPFWCIMTMAAIYYTGTNILRVSQARLPLKDTVVLNAVMIICSGLLIFNNNYILKEPGYLNKGGQETYTVPENTDCIFVIPDGSYNESNEEITTLAQCRRVGVVYAGNLDVLVQDYEYQTGDYLLVEIINSLDENEVLKNLQKTFHIEQLKELDREYASCCVRILLGE